MAEKKLILILKAGALYTKDAYSGGKEFPNARSTNNNDEDLPITPVQGDKISYKDDEDEKFISDELFDTITFSFLPLLRMFRKLETDKVPFKIGIVWPPILCNLLNDEKTKNDYKEYLKTRLELGEREVSRAVSSSLYETALLTLEMYKKALADFRECGEDILGEFKKWTDKGYVENIATTGTEIFMPLFCDIRSSIAAQIETGVRCHRHYFGESPNGFWLPHQAYCEEIESVLRQYNINYTVLNERSFLLSKNAPKRGIFYPASLPNSVACFSNDPMVNEELFGAHGYCQNENYLDPMSDIGYIYKTGDLFPYITDGQKRHSLGFKYYNKSKKDSNFLNISKNVYSVKKAFDQCKKDAKDYMRKKCALLKNAEDLLGETDFLNLVIPIDFRNFLHNWCEAIYFLESCFRYAAESEGEEKISFDFGRDVLAGHYSLEIIHPFSASDSPTGDGGDLVTDKNSYMLMSARKAARRMSDLATRFPDETGLRQRLLRIAMNELLIAEDASWAWMVNNEKHSQYAKKRFLESINDFTRVFDALGTNEVSTAWLINLEKEHDLFGVTNYKVFKG